ncbi:hypothetical protein M8C21_016804 [Ambrosia artemisiifolia]|uniref:Uncharacterized protein n=1 Tax=Ambrosia artemisiifolia TaxID=4212 RepID=A0AAD5D565_AMBAR|nr:hypothetical protein M8C21_016804 [Ambrosia artemisiifolia]
MFREFASLAMVSYDEVIVFVEDRRMKNLKGVKSKELLIWVTVSDISLTEGGKITFGNPPTAMATFSGSTSVEKKKKTSEPWFKGVSIP